jgi:hypothetical protein
MDTNERSARFKRIAAPGQGLVVVGGQADRSALPLVVHGVLKFAATSSNEFELN